MADFFPSVAVVILNWNGKSFLTKFLPSVCATDYPDLKVYMADNASTDESISFVEKEYPQINVLRLSENFGFAEGYNRALAQIKADYYVLLNSDVEVVKDWVLPVIRLMETNPVIAACQPKILSYYNRQYFEYAGAAGGWMDRWGFSFCRGRIFDTVEPDEGQYNESQKVFWASGAAFFIRSALYHQAGGLDPYFFAHMEEIDLCWRLQRMGYQIWCCPESVVYHVGGGSLRQGDPYKVFLNFRNNLIMLHKNLRGFDRWLTLFVRRILDGMAACRSVAKGYSSEVKVIRNAHREYSRWLSQYKKNRANRPQSFGNIKMKDLTGVYSGSVAWQYFGKKRETFSSLKKVKK